MDKTKPNKLKSIGILVLTLLVLGCVIAIFWWSWVQEYAPDKTIFNTFNVSQIENAKDGNQANVIEVRYFTNDNGDGLEMLDVKFNQFYDEDKKGIYSQGLQFVANDPDSSLSDWTFSIQEVPYLGGFGSHTFWTSFDNLPNGTIHTYASGDNFATTLNDVDAIGHDAEFKITLDEDIYLMEMQGTKTPKDKATVLSDYNLGFGSYKVLAYNDVYLMAYKIYNQVQSLANGTTQNIVFSFGDMVNFKEFDGKTYLSEEERESKKVDRRVNEFYVIKVEKFESGAKQASDSLFNNIKGSANFKVSNDYISDDYFYGRTEIVLNFEKSDLKRPQTTIDTDTVVIGPGESTGRGWSYCIFNNSANILASLKPYADKIDLVINYNFRTELSTVAFGAGFEELKNFNIKAVYALYGRDEEVREVTNYIFYNPSTGEIEQEFNTQGGN